MTDKMNVWSEGHHRSDDITHSIDGEEHIGETIVKRGVVLVTDCCHCGRQWKGIIPWNEVAMLRLGHPVEDTMRTRQGILLNLRCNGCQKNGRVIMSWEDLRRYVQAAVRGGMLDPRILNA